MINRDKKRKPHRPSRVPVERRRHSKNDESTPEGDRRPHADPDELNPCAHRNTCGEASNDEDKQPEVND